MKTILRTLVFTAISVRFSQYLLATFDFGEPYIKNFIFICIALALLYFALKPILGMINLPSSGVGYCVFVILLTFVILYVLTLFIPQFDFIAIKTHNLLIFGYMIPSKSLTEVWSGATGSVIVGLTYCFLGSIMPGKK